MKRGTKLLCVIVAMCILLAVPVSADELETRASAFFVSTLTYLYQTDDNHFAVCFEVVAKSKMDELGVSYIEVQRSTDGENWTLMKTYSPSVYTVMLGEDTAYWAGNVSYAGSPGSQYRAVVTYYAKNGNNIGEYETTTDVLQLPPAW